MQRGHRIKEELGLERKVSALCSDLLGLLWALATPDQRLPQMKLSLTLGIFILKYRIGIFPAATVHLWRSLAHPLLQPPIKEVKLAMRFPFSLLFSKLMKPSSPSLSSYIIQPTKHKPLLMKSISILTISKI